MKKKLFSLLGVMVTMVAIVTSVYVNNNTNKNNEIFNANVEALADVEVVLSGICVGNYSNCSIPCPNCNIGLGAEDRNYGIVKSVHGTCTSCGAHIDLNL